MQFVSRPNENACGVPAAGRAAPAGAPGAWLAVAREHPDRGVVLDRGAAWAAGVAEQRAGRAAAPDAAAGCVASMSPLYTST